MEHEIFNKAVDIANERKEIEIAKQLLSFSETGRRIGVSFYPYEEKGIVILPLSTSVEALAFIKRNMEDRMLELEQQFKEL